jgi:hypothetical protein
MSKGMGLQIRTIGELLLHLLPCVGWLLSIQRNKVHCRGWEVSGSLSLQYHRITLCDCSYLEWRIYFKRGIDYFGFNMADPDPASLAGESGKARKENGDYSRNQRMSKISLRFHPSLHH